MAVTKTHPIKSTLKAAIDYICNPDKMEGKLLVSSFGCSAETADIEFAWTRRHAIDKGKSYIEHQAEQNGSSYKAKLRAAIDRLLPDCSDLEDLLRRLQREGYELKRGEYISARAPGKERFNRLKTLGADYADEALTARIVGRPRPSRQPQQRTGKPSLLIDIQNNLKA